jgi:hypothetical protein
VNDRKVWDALVPYGKVWRAGANENTTITFSDPVQIEGKPLDKGTYGLHMIPNADEWTIIFSKNSTSWGAFTYDQAEDALRVTVKPKAADMHNALTYDFDQLQPDSAVVELEWEKIAVPFKVSVDVHGVVQASLKKQLRNLSQYTWISWDDAANYLLAEKVALDDSLTCANKSIENEDRFDNETDEVEGTDGAQSQGRGHYGREERRWNLPARCRSINSLASCREKSAMKKRSPSSAKTRRSIPTNGLYIRDWLGCTARRASLTTRQRR